NPLVSGGLHAASRHKMMFAHTFTDASEKCVVAGISLFKELAEKYSDGRLEVDVREGGKLAGQSELLQTVQCGSVQACLLSMQNLTTFADIYNVLDLPFLFPSTEAFNKYLESDHFQDSQFIKMPEQKGLRVLKGLWANTGMRVVCVNKRQDRQISVPD